MNAVKRIEEFERFGSILGLERMNVLMELLGNPQEALKCVHVAGTNGKGSVSRYIYDSLEANGYRCGLFTSPFIETFNERIQFHGKNISDSELEKVTDIVLDKVSEMTSMGYTSPTEFEVITAEAFLYFAMKNADFVVLEVGLGGSGDSTNVISRPLVSVITSISLDHTDRLGSTIEEIAAEKAGIIKDGCPVVSNADSDAARKVIAKTAYEHKSRLYDVSGVHAASCEEKLGGSVVSADILGTWYNDVEICMTGEFQVRNLITALTVIEILRRKRIISITRESLYMGLARAVQPGRFEIVGEHPYIILDGAHNPDGARALTETVRKYFDRERVLFVTGILADKDAEGILDRFCEAASSFIAAEPASPRRMAASELAERIRRRGIEAEAIADIREAVRTAMDKMESYDAVVFAGSFYLIGEIRRFINEEKQGADVL